MFKESLLIERGSTTTSSSPVRVRMVTTASLGLERSFPQHAAEVVGEGWMPSHIVFFALQRPRVAAAVLNLATTTLTPFPSLATGRFTQQQEILEDKFRVPSL
jgi:hypothetical protein